MTSSINTTIPPFGNPTTAGVRSNFVTAKAEIEQLQTARFIRVQHVNDSVEVFQQCAVNNVQQVIDFNQELFNNGGIFIFDDTNNEIEFAEAGWYGAVLNFHVVRKVSGGGSADFYIHSELKEPAGAFTDFPGSSRIITMEGSISNHKDFRAVTFVSRIGVAGTRLRWLQMATDVTRQIGIVTYPSPAAGIPGAAGVSLSIWKIGRDL